jgi:hypothetical protein
LKELEIREVLVQFSSCDSRWAQRVCRLGRHRLPQADEESACRENEHGTSITGTYLETGTGHEASVLESVMMMMMMMMMIMIMRKRRRRGKGHFSSPKACAPSPGATKPPI